MNTQFYFEKLNESDEFKEFIKENPDAYLCSGFFVIDKEKSDNKTHIDYFSPKQNKIFSFQLEEGTKKVPMENYGEKTPEKLSLVDFDFDEIEKIIKEKMESENIQNKIQKIILSLQKKDGENFIVGTIFISMFGLIKLNINLESMKITDFQKKSFLDILKVSRNAETDGNKEDSSETNQASSQ